MTWRNARGENLQGAPSATIHPRQGDWQPITLFADVPETAEDQKVAQVLLLVFLRNLAPDDVVHIDDVRVCRMSGDSETRPAAAASGGQAGRAAAKWRFPRAGFFLTGTFHTP